MRTLKGKALKEFILQNAEFLTCQDIADESGNNYNVINRLCHEMKIEPIGPKEQKMNFIEENRMKMSPAKIMKTLGITVDHFETLYREMGLCLLEDFKKNNTKPTSTPREIFSHYKVDSANHYQHESNFPSYVK